MEWEPLIQKFQANLPVEIRSSHVKPYDEVMAELESSEERVALVEDEGSSLGSASASFPPFTWENYSTSGRPASPKKISDGDNPVDLAMQLLIAF